LTIPELDIANPQPDETVQVTPLTSDRQPNGPNPIDSP
jgi:hypothetical protein